MLKKAKHAFLAFYAKKGRVKRQKKIWDSDGIVKQPNHVQQLLTNVLPVL